MFYGIFDERLENILGHVLGILHAERDQLVVVELLELCIQRTLDVGHLYLLVVALHGGFRGRVYFRHNLSFTNN